MSYLSTAIKRARYLVTRDTDQVLVLEKTNGTFVDLILDTPQGRDAAITTAVNNLIAGAPGALNTLNELATALGDDANFAATVTTALAGRVPNTGTAWAGTAGLVSFKWQPNPDSAAGVGLRIDRTAAAAKYPTLIFSIDDVTQYGMAGLDTAVADGILAYDYLIPQAVGTKSGDVFRMAHGAHFIMGDGIGTPGSTHRFTISSTGATDDPALTGALLKFTIGAGSPATDHVRGNTAGVDNFNINKNGFAAFGGTYSGSWTNGALEVATAASVKGASVSPTLQLIRSGDLAKSFTFDVTSSGQLRIRDNSRGKSLWTADTNGNLSLGDNANVLATNTTNGFVNVPRMPGPPTGIPTSGGTGVVPIVIDDTAGSEKLWVRVNGAWKSVAFA